MPKEKKSLYTRKYRVAWESDAELKGWIGPVLADETKSLSCPVWYKDNKDNLVASCGEHSERSIAEDPAVLISKCVGDPEFNRTKFDESMYSSIVRPRISLRIDPQKNYINYYDDYDYY
ncbi:unnamed protein product [Acanthoscelides obtectus]|uniref:Uncharacterized protein n=1 Tax=Acanthoscelides obtectus TaxID=200917 RepID=A0A9P0QIJ6_ACAOB|nr:unnamed protein product [Acanthoscelides obtectus]CAK1688686.1 hypothetical protein AOBTE_LOCUS36803 [Acanthoscelides obtectus]